jgi:hypothetical protein
MRTRIVGITDKFEKQIKRNEAQAYKEREMIQHGQMKASDAQYSAWTFNNLHKALNF